MNIINATRQYEEWLGRQIPLIDEDLELKHRKMAGDPFSFLRATFYRWVQLWRDRAGDLAGAPGLLAVGDLHVENFGTWRDIEGRLIWGINDFDEAYRMPYTSDLLRLAVSARLAIREHRLELRQEDACAAILDGYRRGLARRGRPYVLAERHSWLRRLATGSLRDPAAYWEDIEKLPDFTEPMPEQVRTLIESDLPEPAMPHRVAHRLAGLGSLGRQRFTLIAEWRGGQIAREAKQLTRSAYLWREDETEPAAIRYAEIVGGAVRAPDPCLRVNDAWVCRRLAPDCSRIELGSLPHEKDEARLLRAMGSETANVHLGGSDAIEEIEQDLKSRSSRWLHDASVEFADAIVDDWKEWKSFMKG